MPRTLTSNVIFVPSELPGGRVQSLGLTGSCGANDFCVLVHMLTESFEVGILTAGYLGRSSPSLIQKDFATCLQLLAHPTWVGLANTGILTLTDVLSSRVPESARLHIPDRGGQGVIAPLSSWLTFPS